MSEDKNEKPTDKKIEDAREKGQVPVSRDLARLVMLLVVAEIAFVFEPKWREAIESLVHLSVTRIGVPFRHAVNDMVVSAGLLLLLVFAASFVVCSIVSVASHWGQFGVLIAPEAAEPKFDKLNPVNGFKQLFSMKKLFELFMTICKGILIGWVIFLVVRGELPDIVHLAGGGPKEIFYGFLSMLRSTFHIIVGLCVVISLLDLGVQHYFHIKDLMMDKEEIKKEYKETEGDPLIKGQRKQLAREWAMSDPPSKTQKSNAVVVNPTHFAVALLYDPENGAAVPVVMAKGKDEVAQAMIRRARECGIPVIRHVWLARTLYATGRPDTYIPKSSYEAVAYVYAVVHELVAAKETDRMVELESDGEPPETHAG